MNWRNLTARSKVEHPFPTLKRLWGFAMLTMFNINKRGRPLTGVVGAV
jgi:hypothetical protein